MVRVRVRVKDKGKVIGYGYGLGLKFWLGSAGVYKGHHPARVKGVCKKGHMLKGEGFWAKGNLPNKFLYVQLLNYSH